MEERLGRMVLGLTYGFLPLVARLRRSRGRIDLNPLNGMALICGVAAEFMDPIRLWEGGVVEKVYLCRGVCVFCVLLLGRTV